MPTRIPDPERPTCPACGIDPVAAGRIVCPACWARVPRPLRRDATRAVTAWAADPTDDRWSLVTLTRVAILTHLGS